MLEKRMDRGADEIGYVVNDLDVHAGRKSGTQILELLANVVGDAHSVGAGLPENLHGDDVFGRNKYARTRSLP